MRTNYLVGCYKTNGKFIAIFKGLIEASKLANTTRSAVFAIINGDKVNSIHGYTFIKYNNPPTLNSIDRHSKKIKSFFEFKNISLFEAITKKKI